MLKVVLGCRKKNVLASQLKLFNQPRLGERKKNCNGLQCNQLLACLPSKAKKVKLHKILILTCFLKRIQVVHCPEFLEKPKNRILRSQSLH